MSFSLGMVIVLFGIKIDSRINIDRKAISSFTLISSWNVKVQQNNLTITIYKLPKKDMILAGKKPKSVTNLDETVHRLATTRN